jgi:hypothetical protein
MRHLRVELALAVVGFVTIAPSAASQSIERDNFETWFDATTIYRFGDRWVYSGDQGFRALVTDSFWRLLYIRPSFQYDATSWFRVHGGIGFFYAFLDAKPDLLELRPWLGLKFLWPRPAGFGFGHYFRLEERFLSSTASGEWDSSLRARYQLQVKTSAFDVGGAEDFYALAYGEIFEDLSGSLRGLFIGKARLDGARQKGRAELTGRIALYVPVGEDRRR